VPDERASHRTRARGGTRELCARIGCLLEDAPLIGRTRHPGDPCQHGCVQQRRHDFDAIYASESPPPWDIGRPQPAFDRLAKAGAFVGKVLDPGCGTGEHALLAASLGHEVMGVDLSAKAIELAMTKAIARRVEARFLVADALRLIDLDEQFDTVLDCGLFHVFDDIERERYVDSLAAVVPPGGRFHMLCFSNHQPGDWGPRRLTQDEIRAAFSEGWEVGSIEPAVIDLTWDPAGALAWQVAATRT
jgi:SAM-dependent methyltransferase